MSDFIALLLWLSGQPAPAPAPDPGTVEPMGGGIPVQPVEK